MWPLLRAFGGAAGSRTRLLKRDDNAASEELVASALADAERRGIGAICLFLSHNADPALIRRLLADPRISFVGAKDDAAESTLPQDLCDNPRVGRYWEPGDWILPAWPAHVYFAGSWRLFTIAMLRQAMRREAPTLRVRAGHHWAPVPLATIRAVYYRMSFVRRAARFVLWHAHAATRAGRRCVARALLLARPDAIDLALRVAGSGG